MAVQAVRVHEEHAVGRPGVGIPGGLPGARAGRAVGSGEVPHVPAFVDPSRDIAEPGIVDDAWLRQYLGYRDGCSARGAQRCVGRLLRRLHRIAVERRADGETAAVEEVGARLGGRSERLVAAVAQAVSDHDQRSLGGLMRSPGVAAGQLVVQRQADRADGRGVKRERKLRCPGRDTAEHRRARAGRRVEVEHGTESAYSAQPRTEAAGGRLTVAQAFAYVADARPPVKSKKLDAGHLGRLDQPDHDHSASGVLDQVGSELSGDDRDAAHRSLAEAKLAGARRRDALCFADAAHLTDADATYVPHRQSVTATTVPSPGFDLMANSSTKRLEPLRPKPRPCPVV